MLAGGLALTPVAGAAAPARARGHISRQRAHRRTPAARAPRPRTAPVTVSGTVTAAGGGSFTIQTGGREMSVIAALTAAANAVTRQNLPYVYGGGHAQAGTASIGIRGPGYNGRRIGYDCSGSVAAVLAGGSLWQPGSGVPNDAGIVAQLRSEHLVARGAGTGAQEVTLYDNPGVHIFMNIDGRFFGTSDGGAGNASQSKGGAGWLNDGAPDASSRSYHPWHVVPSALGHRTRYGPSVTFEAGWSVASSLATGDRVQVTYTQQRSGVNVASAVTFAGAQTSTGTVSAIAADGSSLTITSATGSSETFSTASDPGMLTGLTIGEQVQVSFTSGTGGVLVVRSVAPAGAPGSTGTGSSGSGETGAPTPGTSSTRTGRKGTSRTRSSGPASGATPSISGQITVIAADDSMFAVRAGRQTLTFSTGGDTALISSFYAGETVTVSYARSGGGLTARSVKSAH